MSSIDEVAVIKREKKMRTFAQKQKQSQPGAASSLVRSSISTPGPSSMTQTRGLGFESGSTATHFGHDFSRLALHAPVTGAQFKLAISEPGDQYEQEADQVADTVMRAPQPLGNRQQDVLGHLPEERVQGNEFGEMAVPPIIRGALGSNGQPLDSSTKEFMGSRFGHDFSRVRIHTDARASESARALNARAYTVGHDVVFDSGFYSPQSNQGRRLLAHELSHVLQQSSAQSIQRMIAVKDPSIDVSGYVGLHAPGYQRPQGEDVYTLPGETRQGLEMEDETVSTMLSSERMFTLKGDTSGEATGNLWDQVHSRMGIVEFARKQKYVFATGEDTKMNPDYWEEADSSEAVVKSDVNPQDAYDDLNVHPNKYAIGCREATNITMRGGSRSPITQDNKVNDADWIPGDAGYVKNTAKGSKSAGLEGENIIYMGDENFWGLSGKNITIKTLTDWMDEVRFWSSGDKSPGSPEVKDFRRRPTKGLS